VSQVDSELLVSAFPEFRSKLEPVFAVEVQETNRCSTDVGQPHDFGVTHHEVLVPVVAPRIEEWNDVPGARIDAREVWPPLSIAASARHGKIRGLIRAAVLAWNNVVNVKCRDRQRFLRDPAIFATIPRPLPNQFAESGIHQDKLCRASAERAFAWRMPMMSIAST
jgi:hypothetical protein